MVEEVIALLVLAMLMVCATIMLMVLVLLLRIRQIFKRALTFVFTISLKPKFKRIKP